MWRTLTRKMKDSGVEWIGEIPEDWEVRKLGNLSQLYTGNSIKDNEKDNYTDNLNSIPYIATKDINNNHTINYKNGMYVKEDDLSFKIALKDSTLVCIEGGSAGSKIAYLNQNVTFGNKLCAVHSGYVNNKYLYYYILSPCFNNSFNSRITGLIPGVTLSEMSKIEIVIPPDTTQNRIVNALDEKVTKISTLQVETKQSIEELKKYKQSLITEAVTKGLDPNVEVKDSGIEVIGKINRNFNLIPLGYLGRLQNGISKSGDYFGSGFPFVSYGDVYKNRVLPSSVEGLVMSTEDEQEYYSVKSGDILFTRTSEVIEEIGMTSVCLSTIPKSTFAGFLIRFRPIENNNLLTEYARYYFEASFIRDFFAKEMNLVTRASLSQPLLKKLPVIMPGVEEQQQIVSYLDEKTSRIDKLIEDKTKVIEELENYKKSLIYEYVTGKKEV